MEEIWKDIGDTGFKISSLGRVYDPKRGYVDYSSDHSAYIHVNLRQPYNGVTSGHVLLHRLVAEAFIPNPDGKPQVNHIDGNKRNNQVDNLEWVTRAENAQHAYMTGLHKKRYGFHYSEEAKEKMSLAHKGKSPWNKGIKLPEEYRAKCGNGFRGRHHTEEAKEKMRAANTGRFVSQETGNKISKTKRGGIWVTNGVEIKYIHPDSFSEYKSLGYTRGRKVG